jgi:cation diffusion facilitator family transporter
MSMKKEQRYQQAKRVTLIGALVNLLLGILKIVFGFIGKSHALIADGFHSLSDLLSDGLVLFASKFGSQEADEDHPYGHQRIETAATMFLSMLLIIAGSGIAWDALDQLVIGDIDTPTLITLIIAMISIIANELLYHYTKHVGLKIDSDLLIANAWHHRSDAASSIVVFIGILGSILGVPILDSIAAVIVGIMIIKMGGSLGWDSIKELIDTAVEPKLLEKIRATIKSVPGVIEVHQLRSRLMGGEVYIDVHILVDEKISVSEGHHIAQNVHHALVKQIDKVKDVTVHVDPEDDEVRCPSLHLPPRERLMPLLSQAWQDLAYNKHIKRVIIHYIDGKIHLDIQFEGLTHLEPKLKSLYLDALKDIEYIETLNIQLNVNQ